MATSSMMLSSFSVADYGPAFENKEFNYYPVQVPPEYCCATEALDKDNEADAATPSMMSPQQRQTPGSLMMSTQPPIQGLGSLMPFHQAPVQAFEWWMGQQDFQAHDAGPFTDSGQPQALRPDLLMASQQEQWAEPSVSSGAPITAAPPGVFLPMHQNQMDSWDDASHGDMQHVPDVGMTSQSHQIGGGRTTKDESSQSYNWNAGKSGKTVTRSVSKPKSDFADKKNTAMMNAQCHLKMLLPNHIAGAIIGRDGNQIGEILLLTRCLLQISACNDFFPGTNDRIVIMGGSMAGLTECIKCVLRCWSSAADLGKRTNRSLLCKLAVPCSVVSSLIGCQGDRVKWLSERTQCKINMSPRVEGMQERIVLVCGQYECIVEAVVLIAQEIQGDSHTKEHLSLKYDIQIPLGAWSGTKANPVDPSAPLIPPADASEYSKRELITYLQQAAPRAILLRHNLLGRMENIMKCKGQLELKSALQETWDARVQEVELDQVSIRENPSISLHKQILPPGEIKFPLPTGLISTGRQDDQQLHAEALSPRPNPTGGSENVRGLDKMESLAIPEDAKFGDAPNEDDDSTNTWTFNIPIKCFQKPDNLEAFQRLRDAYVRFEDGCVVVAAHDMLGHSEVIVCSHFAAPLDIAKCSYRIDPNGREININVKVQFDWTAMKILSETDVAAETDAGDFLAAESGAEPRDDDGGQLHMECGTVQKTHDVFSSYAQFL